MTYKELKALELLLLKLASWIPFGMDVKCESIQLLKKVKTIQRLKIEQAYEANSAEKIEEANTTDILSNCKKKI